MAELGGGLRFRRQPRALCLWRAGAGMLGALVGVQPRGEAPWHLPPVRPGRDGAPMTKDAPCVREDVQHCASLLTFTQWKDIARYLRVTVWDWVSGCGGDHSEQLCLGEGADLQ